MTTVGNILLDVFVFNLVFVCFPLNIYMFLVDGETRLAPVWLISLGYSLLFLVGAVIFSIGQMLTLW